MKISTNAINALCERYNCAGNLLPSGIDTLVTKIGAQLGAVEEVSDFGAKYQGAVIVNIVSCIKHDNSDHLNVCRIDDGGAIADIERGDDGLVQVVCGAPNVHADMLAVWLPPGSTVPDSYDTEPFVLGSRELRGVMSNGMLASAKELALGDDHSGILEIEDRTPGESFADAFGLTGDTVIEIENKMFTHRPDCFGFLGVAREIAGIQGLPFKSPDWYVEQPPSLGQASNELPFSFTNQLPDLVPRFSAVALADVKVTQSPVWLRLQLVRHGLKPINNIVDLTNFYMILTGQPLHAYDYDKVKKLNNDETPQLFVRHPHEGEQIALLNGKTIEPRAESVLVATSHNALALGGIMGGSETEVDENTKNIILECANFNMYNVRRTSMTHGLFTDAVTRFNKGQSPYQTVAVLSKIVQDIQDRNYGTIASQLIDDKHIETERNSITITPDFVNQRLGLSLEGNKIKTLLENVEFSVVYQEQSLTIQAPFWRTDISIQEDIVEEVGRLYGFDLLARNLPERSIQPVAANALLAFKTLLRNTLAKLGANELLTYSFVHGNLLTNTHQDKELAFKINNALSPDLHYYRLSLTPSLLNHVHGNIKAGYPRFALFEIGKTHNKGSMHEGLPHEHETLALTYASNAHTKQPAFYEARNYLNELASSLGVTLDYRLAENTANDQHVINPFETSRTSMVFIAGTDSYIGVVGEYKSSVYKKLKLPQASAGFEISIDKLMAAVPVNGNYVPLSRYPHVSQDICLQIEANLLYQQVTQQFVQALLSQKMPSESINWQPIDIYSSDDLQGKKRITYRVTLTSNERTLSDAVLSKLLDDVSNRLADSIGAERI